MATVERLRTFWGERQVDRGRLTGLATAYWEVALYGVVVAAALGLRLWNLDARAIHHDESLHMYYAWEIFQGKGFEHVPFMHGPLKFFASALAFRLWPFGFDTDFSARLVPALAGTALVGLPFFLRDYLGRTGALIASLLLAVSPVLLYVSRFNRDDILIVAYTLGMVVVMWRYLRDQKESYLLAVPLLLMLGFTTMEATFITTGIFLVFLNFLLATDLVDQLRASRQMTQQETVLAYVALFPTAWLLASFWPLLAGPRRRWGLTTMPAAGHLLVVMGTFALPQFSAAVQKIPLLSLGKVDVPNDPSEQNLMRATTLIFLLASAYIGLLWNWRRWGIGAVIFYVPFFLLYTSFFTNGGDVWNPRGEFWGGEGGFWTGIWGSLDYWLGQQLVRRGGQPDYYYVTILPVYEFLPLIFATGGALYYAFRGKLEQQMLAFGALMLVLLFSLGADNLPLIGHWHLPITFIIPTVAVLFLSIDRFTKFLLFWTLATFFAITIAGERMPWLTVHITLPIIILAAKVLDDILSTAGVPKAAPAPEPAAAPKRGRKRAQPVEAPAATLSLDQLSPFVYVGMLGLLAAIVFIAAGPASPASVLAWLFAAGAAGVLAWTVRAYSWRFAGQVAAVGLVAALFAFTLRAAGMAAYDEGDPGGNPPELLIYAQGSPQLDELRDDIDRLAAVSGQGRDLKIVLDNSEGVNVWPWPWYLRDYEGHGLSYDHFTADFVPEPNSIVLVGTSNATKLEQYADKAERTEQYTHMWWFPENYKGLTVSDFLGDVFSGDYFDTWRRYFIDRELANVQTGPDRTAYFFGDFEPIEVQQVTPPTVDATLDAADQTIVGGAGDGRGEFSQPADIAVDAAGNAYVVDTLNHRIQKFGPDGDVLSSFGEAGTGDGQFADPFSDDYQNHDGPWGVAVDRSGNIYVADTWNHRIQKFDANGRFVARFGATEELSLFGPRDIAIDAEGNLFVTDTGNKRIVKLSPGGDVLREFGSEGSGEGQFNEPSGIAVGANGDIYVADYWNRRIQRFDTNFNFLSQIRIPSWGSHGITDRPYLTVLPDGTLLATDPANARLLVHDPTGKWQAAWTLPEDQTVDQRRPIGIAASAQGQVYVSDGSASLVRQLPLAALLSTTAPP